MLGSCLQSYSNSLHPVHHLIIDLSIHLKSFKRTYLENDPLIPLTILAFPGHPWPQRFCEHRLLHPALGGAWRPISPCPKSACCSAQFPGCDELPSSPIDSPATLLGVNSLHLGNWQMWRVPPSQKIISPNPQLDLASFSIFFHFHLPVPATFLELQQ